MRIRIPPYTARYGKNRVVRRGKETRVVTDWYRTSGAYHEFVNDQLVSGTEKHDSGLLSGIEPFDTESNVVYKPEYVAGFASERYSVGLKAAWEKAKKLYQKPPCFPIFTKKIRDDHHADHVDGVKVKTVYRNITYKYLMLPVWMSSFVYKGKVYQFMVNGRTGKVSGKAPISPLRGGDRHTDWHCRHRTACCFGHGGEKASSTIIHKTILLYGKHRRRNDYHSAAYVFISYICHAYFYRQKRACNIYLFW